MIISASRRTDMPAFYAGWFFNRIREGFVDVRNPFAHRQVSRVSLLPGNVTGFVFWSKNPAPMVERLDELTGFAYYFQITLTPYGPQIEPGVPDQQTVVLPAIRRLADRIGPERIIWRYDPIFVSETYSPAWHEAAFSRLAKALKDCTRQCTISFLDNYRNTRRHESVIAAKALADPDRRMLACRLAKIAAVYGIAMDTCAEMIDLEDCGIGHGRCVDKIRFEQQLGYPLDIPRDTSQRTACGCSRSVDIGQYNTCQHGCCYCYANYSEELVSQTAHDPASPLIYGKPAPNDTIRMRKR